MKKITAQIIALIAINASAYDITNTVTIVSNIYNRISEEHWITNNIKNTHTNYHYTNNVYTVSNVTLLVSQQTFKTNTTVNLDVSQQAIADARAQANRASQFAADALGYASSAAEQAGNAQEHSLSAQNFRDEAEYYANQAHAQVQPIIDEGARQIAAVKDAADIQVGRVNSVGNSNVGSVNSAGRTVLNNIDAKQAWFDQHFGQMVTNIDINVSTNFYIAEDMLARAGVAQNAEDIASLESRVGDNIQQLTTRMGTAEGNIQELKSSVTSVANLATNNQTAISAANGRIDDLDVILNCDVVPIVTQVVYRCKTIPAWTFRVRTDRFTMRGEEKCFEILDQVGMEHNNLVSSYNWCPASWSYRTRIETTSQSGAHEEVTYSLANDFLHEFTVVMHQLIADVYYSFEEIGRTFEPTDLGKKVPVRKADLFAGYWKPAESDFSNLTGVVKVATSDVRSRLDDVEARLDVRATEIANYSVSRSYVVWTFYYTYSGSLMIVKLKIYTDRPRLVSSDATSKTYEYDYEVVQSGSSFGWMDYVRKKCVTSAGNDSEVTVRLYRSVSGYSNLVCDGFSEGVSDFTGTHSVGSTVVTKSIRYYQYVFNEKMDDQTRTLLWTVNADLNIYDANGSKIGRLMRDTDWSALSNWVERVFQKK